MSEPNGDSSQNPPPAPPDNPGAEGAAPSNLARAPRVNMSGQKEPAAAPAGAPPGFAEFMAWMQTMNGGQPPAEDDKTARGPLRKEQKKFSRRTIDPAKPTAASDEAGAADEASAESDAPAAAEGDRPAIAPPLTTLPTDFLTAERKRRNKEGTRSIPVMLLTQLLAFGLIVGSFFVGRATVPKPAPAPVTAPAAPVTSTEGKPGGLLPPELAEKVDQALTAESEGNLRKASDLLQSVKQAGGHITGMDYHLATLAYVGGDLARVLPLLNQSIAEGEEVAACYNLRGTLSNRQGGINAGLPDMEMAAKLDPFSARNAFFVGEAMRRQGKPQGAVIYLRRAISALQEPMLESFYQLKLRLTQIELGQEKEVSEEMAAKLAMSPPPVDWIFTAAALEMHRGNFPAAAAQLDKAKALIPEAEMQTRLRDFFFYGFSEEKELARFFGSIKANAPLRGGDRPFSTNNPFDRKAAPGPGAGATPGTKPDSIDGSLPDLPVDEKAPKTP